MDKYGAVSVDLWQQILEEKDKLLVMKTKLEVQLKEQKDLNKLIESKNKDLKKELESLTITFNNTIKHKDDGIKRLTEALIEEKQKTFLDRIFEKLKKK